MTATDQGRAKIGAGSSHGWALLSSATLWSIAFWTIALIGGALRFYGLGHIPAGLNGDEAEEGVEAMSLLETSMDRWGDHFPIFFPHVGSGMQPLYTYLTVPLFALLGPSVLALRLTSAVLGFLTIFVTYFVGKLHFGRSAGLLSMLLVALLPWHMMQSRWGIDWSILPFWFSLGLITLTMALRPAAHWAWRVIALAPWAVAIYAYLSSAIPIATISLITIVCFRGPILAQWRSWICGLAVALVIDTPIIMFLCVNFLNMTLPLRLSLPFSIPVLPVSRFTQIEEPFPAKFVKNVTFLISGYRDSQVWNQSANFMPLTAAAPILTIMALIASLADAIKNRRANLILIVMLSALVPILFVRLNLNRFNWFYIPSIALCSGFIVEAIKHIDNKATKIAFLTGASTYLIVFISSFYLYYFSQYNTEILSEDISLGNGFRVGLDEALHAAARQADRDEIIYLDAGSAHPYLYVLFYGLADARGFQATKRLRPDDDKLYHVVSFGRFVFEYGGLPKDTPYVFVTRPDRLPCGAPDMLETGSLWSVGRCLASSERKSDRSAN